MNRIQERVMNQNLSQSYELPQNNELNNKVSKTLKEKLKIHLICFFSFLFRCSKKNYSILIFMIIFGNCGVKMYFRGKDIFSPSEYGIYLQALLICGLGIHKSSFLTSSLTISNIILTYLANYIDALCVKYLGNKGVLFNEKDFIKLKQRKMIGCYFFRK
jgi:hypothetical protein